MLVTTVGEVDVGNYTGGFFVCLFFFLPQFFADVPVILFPCCSFRLHNPHSHAICRPVSPPRARSVLLNRRKATDQKWPRIAAQWCSVVPVLKTLPTKPPTDNNISLVAEPV